jgi:hypothetical protein
MVLPTLLGLLHGITAEADFLQSLNAILHRTSQLSAIEAVEFDGWFEPFHWALYLYFSAIEIHGGSLL